MNIQSSFTVYTAALHALILNPLLFAYYWLGLSWSDLEWLYFIKTKLFISKNKQQETLRQQQAAGEAKHSAENTINFSLFNGLLEESVVVLGEPVVKRFTEGRKV